MNEFKAELERISDMLHDRGELLLEIDRLGRIVADYRADFAKVIKNECSSDERHCGCVPILRQQISYYQNLLVLIITALEGKKFERAAELAKEGIDKVVDSVQVSTSLAVGEYWVNLLDEIEAKYDQLTADYRDVCEKRLSAAEAFTKQIIDLENQIREMAEVKK